MHIDGRALSVRSCLRPLQVIHNDDYRRRHRKDTYALRVSIHHGRLGERCPGSAAMASLLNSFWRKHLLMVNPTHFLLLGGFERVSRQPIRVEQQTSLRGLESPWRGVALVPDHGSALKSVHLAISTNRLIRAVLNR